LPPFLGLVEITKMCLGIRFSPLIDYLISWNMMSSCIICPLLF
jgi:hypothetical protein